MLIPINALTRLSKDVELRYSPSGAAIARLSFVNSRKYKTQSGEEREDVCFIEGVAFGKTAEIINQYCKKGDRLFVQGLLKQDTWTTDEGKNMSKHSINIEAIEFVEKKSDDAPKAKAEPKVIKQIQVDDDGGEVPF